MAYQTGSVASPTALKTVIETFCTDNGWTLSGSDYLYKGQSNVKLTISSTTGLQIVGANSSDGLTELAPATRQIYIDTPNWPVTYYLFANSVPDMVCCVLQYNTNYMQQIIFGDIVKIHNSAYVGGNWFFASRTTTSPTYATVLSSLTDTTLAIADYPLSPVSSSPGPCIPFPTITNSRVTPADSLHCKIDGNIWTGVITSDSSAVSPVTITDYTVSLLFRSPNTWNSQAQLIPIHLQFSMASSLKGYLGYIEHIRFVRIDNYEIGDIITLGADRWKVFPWVRKSTTYRNGAEATEHSGTVGFAVRYDGP